MCLHGLNNDNNNDYIQGGAIKTGLLVFPTASLE
jgi:hypothetical protein